MKAANEYSSKEYRYALGKVVETGQLYLCIPVTNGLVDYVEFYEVSVAEYSDLLANVEHAIAFANECRLQTIQDHRLIQKPGWNRGTPY